MLCRVALVAGGPPLTNCWSCASADASAARPESIEDPAAVLAASQAAPVLAHTLWLPALALSRLVLVDLAESSEAWAAATRACAAASWASGGPLAGAVKISAWQPASPL